METYLSGEVNSVFMCRPKKHKNTTPYRIYLRKDVFDSFTNIAVAEKADFGTITDNQICTLPHGGNLVCTPILHPCIYTVQCTHAVKLNNLMTDCVSVNSYLFKY